MTIAVHLHAMRSEPFVALTFDDGPNPPVTDAVLDQLAAFDARATFFVIGRWVERWPATVARIVRERHEIGNHTQTHQWGVGDYDMAQPAMEAVAGGPVRFARAPAFDYESCGQSGLIRSGALQLVDADVNPSDWDCRDGAEIARRVLAHPSLSGGSIIDLHDGYDQEDREVRLSRPAGTLAALPVILRGLRERGLGAVRLCDMTFGPGRPLADMVDDRFRERARDAARGAVR
jgi:peptidoglycan/xylan/chitin deacetylase (PgdA/CDA1 family)